MREIPLGGDRVALVDEEDYDRVLTVGRWRAQLDGKTFYAVADILHPDGGLNGRGYARHTLIKMHKFITGYERTDHKDRNGLNNQRSNMREASQSQNGANVVKRSGTSSEYKGVTWHSTGFKWQAQIKVNRKRIYLGLFVSEEEAARAYDRAAVEQFGEFACLNFPS